MRYGKESHGVTTPILTRKLGEGEKPTDAETIAGKIASLWREIGHKPKKRDHRVLLAGALRLSTIGNYENGSKMLSDIHNEVSLLASIQARGEIIESKENLLEDPFEYVIGRVRERYVKEARNNEALLPPETQESEENLIQKAFHMINPPKGDSNIQ